MMKPPVLYPYDPCRELVALAWTFAACPTILVLVGVIPKILGIAVILPVAGLGVLITLRRHAYPRCLVLEEEGTWIPSGFLRKDLRRVDFAEVCDLWEVFLPFGVAVLCLRYHGKTFEVHSSFLPDSETYEAVGQSICSRVEACQSARGMRRSEHVIW